MSSNQNLYTATSPYRDTNVVDGKFLDVMSYRAVSQNPSDVYYEITSVYEFRPDLLAYDLYNDANLWWVFAARNPNLLGPDPYFNMVAGLQIYVATQSTLQKALGI